VQHSTGAAGQADRFADAGWGQPGLAIIDQDDIDKILKAQNMQNSDRFSPETAVRIGKLAGASDMILVGIDDFSSTRNSNKSGNTTTTTGTVVLRAEIRILDVQTGVIVGQPTASFQDSKELSRVSTGSSGFTAPMIPFHPRIGSSQPSSTSNGDPQVQMDNLNSAGIDAVSADLGTKLTEVLAINSKTAAASVATAAATEVVAGIRNGLVYISADSASGVQPGQRFQVVRLVDTGLVNPKTNKPIQEKQSVCLLVVVNVVDDTTSSGKCDGSIPKSGDIAQPIAP
jgi:hypothetical protein